VDCPEVFEQIGCADCTERSGLPGSTFELVLRVLALPSKCLARSDKSDSAAAAMHMMEVHTCSICGWAYVGHGNDAQPINDGRCCDQCYTRQVVPERARRILESDAKREGNGGPSAA